MRERLLFALIPLVSTPVSAAPVEEYSRLQTQFVNQLKETSTGIALPAQDFKRYSAVATFSDGDKSYSMIVCRILYGDMVQFLISPRLTSRTTVTRRILSVRTALFASARTKKPL